MTQINSVVDDGPIMTWWHRCRALPGGARLFSRLLGWFIPYTGSIGARVEELRPGYARVSLRDRRRVRNHLDSIHAIALVNLGEVATGLAVLSGLSAELRGILVGIEVEYLKKARGRIEAIAEFELPEQIGDDTRHHVEARLRDASGETVTLVQAIWQLGYKPT